MHVSEVLTLRQASVLDSVLVIVFPRNLHMGKRKTIIAMFASDRKTFLCKSWFSLCLKNVFSLHKNGNVSVILVLKCFHVLHSLI